MPMKIDCGRPLLHAHELGCGYEALVLHGQTSFVVQGILLAIQVPSFFRLGAYTANNLMPIICGCI